MQLYVVQRYDVDMSEIYICMNSSGSRCKLTISYLDHRCEVDDISSVQFETWAVIY